MKENYPHLRDIKFADSLSDHGPMKIGLLIGSDYIWNFFDGSTIRGRNQLKVVQWLSQQLLVGYCPAL